ncbi:hypothetical protein DYB38_008340 [Aphanomyces astaci]|uniref:DDE Tnp4 domain-containing protein n=1 Tax=Aphanomyces astaci TaxID=112090 RepID=A0A397E6C2_APHAT|nr:hypothetical protein DYB38_008340 [Aphanomyces astaci]
MARRASLQGSQAAPPLTSRNISQGLALLTNLDQQRQAKRARYSTVRAEEPDENLDSTSPIYDAFVDDQGPDGILTMTNFSPSEFNILWADIRQYLSKHWNTGYQGIQREVRAVLPTKKPIGGVLTADELRTNDRIASDRVIVENFFGRLKTLWSVCSDIYAWKRQNYDMLFQTCLALTNVHVRIHKLRAEDGDANTQYVNRLISIGSKIVKNKKAASRTYRSKRKVRLSLAMAAESAFTAADPGGSDTEIGSHSESDSGRLFY